MTRSTGRLLIPILLALSCISCIHIPKMPYQDVRYSGVFEGRDSTTILGEIELKRGNKYQYKVSNIPQGSFNMGVFFKVKQGPPWFPDSEFPREAVIRVSVFENQQRHYDFVQSLAEAFEMPWGPNQFDRALYCGSPSPVKEIERWIPTLIHVPNGFVIRKEQDWLSCDWSSCWPLVCSKADATYTIIFEILKGDPKADKLTSYAGIECYALKLIDFQPTARENQSR